MGLLLKLLQTGVSYCQKVQDENLEESNSQSAGHSRVGRVGLYIERTNW